MVTLLDHKIIQGNAAPIITKKEVFAKSVQLDFTEITALKNVVIPFTVLYVQKCAHVPHVITSPAVIQPRIQQNQQRLQPKKEPKIWHTYMKGQKHMVAILYDFNWDYFICNIYDSYWNFIIIASYLSDVIIANVAQIYTSVL